MATQGAIMSNAHPLPPADASQPAWLDSLVRRLVQADVRPDLISASSVAVAVFGAALLCASYGLPATARSPCLILVAACIEARVLANRLDGQVAKASGRGTVYGPLWNALPDRLADIVFLAAAGYATWSAAEQAGVALGWISAVLAVLAAYVRELSLGLGLSVQKRALMGKCRRMHLLAAACLVSALEPLWRGQGQVLLAALMVLALGSGATVVGRTRDLARALKAAPQP